MTVAVACRLCNFIAQRASATVLRLSKILRHAHFKTSTPLLPCVKYGRGSPSTFTSLRVRSVKLPFMHRVTLVLAFILLILLSMDVADQSDDEAVKFWVRNYVEWHDANRYNASRVAVFLPVKAGLADNVKGMLNMWTYAVLTKRLLLLKADEPVPISDVLSERAINRFVYRKEYDGDNRTWTGGNVRFTYGSGLTPTMRELLRGRRPVVALHMSKAQPITTLIPRLRSVAYGSTRIPPFTVAARRAVARILLEPNMALSRSVEGFTRRLGTPYLAVHARLGAGTNEGKHLRFAFIRGRERDIALCLARAAWELARDAVQPIFVATDTPSFRPVFRAVLREVMPHASVHHVEGNVAHYRWLKGSEAGRKAHFAMHVENLLIGAAEHIVALESGFPEIAYWRGHARSYKKVTFKECGM